MNWKEIKEKYPKGYRKLHNPDDYDGDLKWLLWDELHLRVYNEQYNTRDLYDFFDEQGIVFNGGFYFSQAASGYGFTIWTKIAKDFALISPNDMEIKLMDSLKEAEEQAFIKAFEILEGAI